MTLFALGKKVDFLSIRVSNALIAAIFAFLAIVILIPVLAVDVPPLVDYPNHLAKMYLAVHLKNDPALQEFYQVGLRLTPNLAQDFVVPALSRLFGVENALRIFLGWSLLQIAIGTMALHFAVTGRLGWWPLGAFALVYNWVVAWGFLNYIFTVGLALNFFALWIWLADRSAPFRTVFLALLVPAIFILHMIALGVFGLCVGGYQLWRTAEKLRDAGLRGWRNVRNYAEIFVGIPAFLIMLMLWAASPTGEGGGKTEYGGVHEKAIALMSPVLIDGGQLDRVMFPVLCAVMLALVVSRRIRILPQLGYPLAVMALTAVLMPNWLFGVFGADFRLPFVVGCLLFASADFKSLQWPEWAMPLSVLAVVLVVIRIGFITADWVAVDARFREFRQALHSIPQGSKLLPVINVSANSNRGARDYLRRYWHMSAFAVIDRSSFDPLIFSSPSRQSITVRPEHRAYDAYHSIPVHTEMLRITEDEYPAQRAELEESDNDMGYWFHWWRNFDYVLWINFGQGENPLPDRLELVAAGSFFRLFAVHHSLRSGDEQ